MKKNIFNYGITIIGFILLIIGLVGAKTVAANHGMLSAFPHVLVGLGCGFFGQGMGSLISRRALKNSPEIQRQLEIDLKDERNIAIGNRAKARAYDIMVFVFGALMVAFALMGVDLTVVLLLVFAYLFVTGSGVYYRCRFDKEM